MLLCGETNGLIAIIEIGTANSKQPMRKISEQRVTDKNISKVVRTTRNDFVLGTSSGIVFAQLVKDPKTNGPMLRQVQGGVMLKDKDVTEVSEF